MTNLLLPGLTDLRSKNRGIYLYCQFLDFPSVSHSTVVAIRLSRVGSVLASVIHSIYSRWCEGGICSKFAFAFLFFFNAAPRAGGIGGTALGSFLVAGFLIPCSLSFAASLISASTVLSAGRSFTEVMRSKCPIEVLFFTCNTASGSLSNDAFQKPKEQCCLKLAILQSRPPLYSKKGMPHLTVSVAAGQALCTSWRKCPRMGRANSADFA